MKINGIVRVLYGRFMCIQVDQFLAEIRLIISLFGLVLEAENDIDLPAVNLFKRHERLSMDFTAVISTDHTD